ncbi:MAG: helix-turn-helix domain-containing protein [Lachnospiraceae bacterium]
MVILIADDDKLVRFSIKSMLGEILEDSEAMYIEATNGYDMIKLCRERKPDIAFVDIKMPCLDGLTAISESKKYSEDTEYVIISGFSDFEFAQRGIRLGVNEYILKPVDEEELCKIMINLQKKLKLRKSESNSRFQLRVMEMFGKHSISMAANFELSCHENNYIYLGFTVFVKTNNQNKAVSNRIQHDLIKNIQKLGEEVVVQKGYYAIPTTNEGFPCALFWIKKEFKEYITSHMRKIISFTTIKNTEIFHYVLWFEKETLEEVYQVCGKMDQEVYIGMNYRPGDIYEYQEDRLDQKNKGFLKSVEKLMNAWEMADGIACNEIMNKLWRTYKDEILDVNLENVSKYCTFITGVDISNESLKIFCKSLVEHSDQMYEKVATREESNMIEQVKKYVQEYYMNDISISQIAEHYDLTANYLSTVFHRKTGNKFIDYLTQVRMEAAKKLLIQNASASVQDVALMVGYNSARHFSSQFQKTTGETPTVYRKKRL